MANFFSNIFTRFKKRQIADARDVFYFDKIYFKRINTLYSYYLESRNARFLKSTAENISPLNLLFEAFYGDVLKTIDKPKYFYNNNSSDNNHKVIVARHQLAGVEFTVQYQFYNDQLFFVAFDLSRKIKSEKEKVEVTEAIIDKYLDGVYEEEDFPLIQDQQGNFIIINDEMNFSLCYFSQKIHVVFDKIFKNNNALKSQNIQQDLTKLSSFF